MLVALLLLGNAVWHGLAFWHFAVYPARTLARTTRERPVHPIATELFRFLGVINVALVVLALASVFSTQSRTVALLSLAVANASQFIIDVRVSRLGLVHGALFRQIYRGDAAFTALNTLAWMLS